MKPMRFPAAMAFIVLYYSVFGLISLILVTFIMLNAGILIGLGIGLVLGVIGGIFGGELEYIRHRNIQYKKFLRERDKKSLNKVVYFPIEKEL